MRRAQSQLLVPAPRPRVSPGGSGRHRAGEGGRKGAAPPLRDESGDAAARAPPARPRSPGSVRLVSTAQAEPGRRAACDSLALGPVPVVPRLGLDPLGHPPAAPKAPPCLSWPFGLRGGGRGGGGGEGTGFTQSLAPGSVHGAHVPFLV